MRCWWAVLLTGLLAGCTNAAVIRQSELEHWVGRPETELAAAMGAPNRTYIAGKMKFLTYEERRVAILPAGPGYFGPGSLWYGGGGGLPPTATTLVCDTTFTVTRGVVQAFSFRGNACG